MTDLDDVSRHFHDKISSLRRVVDLSAAELPQKMMKKLGKEFHLLEALLEELEKCVDEQKEQLKQLKNLELSFQKNMEDLQHIKENIPVHMPRKKEPPNEPGIVQKEATEVQVAPAQKTKMAKKAHIREMAFITMPEFEAIPQYMKGRASYDQINAVVQSINTAVAAKYKILQQSAKSLNVHSRNLHQRFKEQETKNTKGQYFVVDEDVREFTQMKIDKRFQVILSMLRHCQRLRELRGGGLTRYVLL